MVFANWPVRSASYLRYERVGTCMHMRARPGGLSIYFLLCSSAGKIVMRTCARQRERERERFSVYIYTRGTKLEKYLF